MHWFSQLRHKPVSQSQLEVELTNDTANHEVNSESSHPHISRLPYELERKICEIAIYNFPKCLPTLILVARRFRIWFEPELYRIIRSGRGRVIPPLYIDKQMGDGSICTTLDRPRIQASGHHAHHVLLQKRTPEEIGEVLQCCPNVSNLALWLIQGRECALLIPILEKIPLRKFSFDPSVFFPNFSADLGIPFDQPMFYNITHLRIINASSMWSKWQQLARLPKLTHLAVGGSTVDQSLLDRALEECQALELLIMFFYSAQSLGDVTSPPNDDRIVLIKAVGDSLDEWEKGACGEEDFWLTAEVQKEQARMARMRRDALLHA